MKKMNILILSMIVLNIGLGACEFTITNDTGSKVYISMNPKLANVVHEKTLQTSTSVDDETDPKAPIKKDFAIARNGTGKTPFTKQFDVYMPLKSNGLYERRYRVHMKYCKDAQFNSMKISQIQNAKKGATEPESIDMKRFEVVDFNLKHEACKAGELCKPHAPKFEHEHEYKAQEARRKTELNNATEQERKEPGYLLENKFIYKEILP